MTEPLHDEEAFKPDNLFNEKKFSTILVNRDGFTAKQNETADQVLQLLDPGITRVESEELFKSLYKANAQELLVETIRNAKTETDKKTLAAACWETGLDFSAYFLFFADLVMHSAFGLAMEALTVIQEMADPPHAEMSSLLAQLNKASDTKSALVPELRDFIHTKIHST